MSLICRPLPQLLRVLSVAALDVRQVFAYASVVHVQSPNKKNVAVSIICAVRNQRTQEIVRETKLRL